MVDGAAWVRQLETQPAPVYVLPHAEALALARALAAAQAAGTPRVLPGKSPLAGRG